MIIKAKYITTFALALLLISGCTVERPAEYYDTVAARSNALVKLSDKTIDIYSLKLSASLLTAVDVTNLDTARQFTISEIAYPGLVPDSIFSAKIDMLDYTNFLSAIKNFLSQSDRVDLPMFYTVSNNFALEYQRESGLRMTGDSSRVFTIPSADTDSFLVFLMSLPILAEKDTIPGLQAKLDSIEVLASTHKKKIVKQYSLKPLQLISKNFKSDPIPRSSKHQVKIDFEVYNPNLYNCEFSASFSLNSQAGNTFYSFLSEGNLIESRKQRKFTAACNLSEFEAKRIDNIRIQILDTSRK